MNSCHPPASVPPAGGGPEVGPHAAKAKIPFQRPSDCLGKTERVGGQPVCVTRLDDGSTLLRWGGSDVWLGVFTEQRSDFGPAVMSGLVRSSLSSG